MDSKNPFEPDVIYEIFKHVWARSAEENASRKDIEETEMVEDGPTDGPGQGTGASKKPRPTTANSNALKLTCELLRLFVSELVHRAAMEAQAENAIQIEGSHLEKILPQLLLDF